MLKFRWLTTAQFTGASRCELFLSPSSYKERLKWFLTLGKSGSVVFFKGNQTAFESFRAAVRKCPSTLKVHCSFCEAGNGTGSACTVGVQTRYSFFMFPPSVLFALLTACS